MYDELVKRLRICPDYNEGCVNCPHEHDLGCRTTTMHEAADAIEELMRRYEQFPYMPPPAWIPVTERLPDEYKDVLCYYEYFRYGDFNCMFRTIDRGYYGNGRWGGEAGQGHRNKVLAWMPLPELPKEARE